MTEPGVKFGNERRGFALEAGPLFDEPGDGLFLLVFGQHGEAGFLFARRLFEGCDEPLRYTPLGEGMTVGPALPDRPEKSIVFLIRRDRVVEHERSQQIWLAGDREGNHLVVEPKAAGGQAEVEERGAAAHDQFAPIWI